MKKVLFYLLSIFSLSLSAQETSYTCGSTPVTLTASATGGVAPITYQWTGPGGTTTSASRSVNVAGTYTWTATDANGCTATGTHTLVIEPNPAASITINATNTCINSPQEITATGVPAGYTFAWSFGTDASPNTGSTNSTNVSYTSTGTKTITLTITKSFTGTTNGCSTACVWTKTKTITVGSLTGNSTCN